MSKMAAYLVAFIVFAVAQVLAVPQDTLTVNSNDPALQAAARQGNYPLLLKLVGKMKNIKPFEDLSPFGNALLRSVIPTELHPIFFSDIRSLRPPADNSGTVYGTAKHDYSEYMNNNGNVRENRGGYRLINNNGEVTEYRY